MASGVNVLFKVASILTSYLADWDIEVIDDDSSTVVHSWRGYPNGNTDAAWVDDVSTADASVMVKPGFTAYTRSITQESANIFELNNKLIVTG